LTSLSLVKSRTIWLHSTPSCSSSLFNFHCLFSLHPLPAVPIKPTHAILAVNCKILQIFLYSVQLYFIDWPCCVKWPTVRRSPDGVAGPINKKKLYTVYKYLKDLRVHC
jgi:hypothetical protein